MDFVKTSDKFNNKTLLTAPERFIPVFYQSNV